MPNIYAHERFGCDVYRALPKEIKELLRKERRIYHIGVQGPDILFYYYPLIPNDVRKDGGRIHDAAGRDFFLRAAEVLAEPIPPAENEAHIGEWNPEALKRAEFVYACGCLCHFVLDSHCHPTVNEYRDTLRITHSQIEGEFDHFLLTLDGKDPVQADLTANFRPHTRGDVVIPLFYSADPPRKVIASMRMTVGVQKLLYAPSDKKRLALKAGLTLFGPKGPSLKGHIVPKEPDPRCAEVNSLLTGRYAEALPKAAELIKALYAEYQAGLYGRFTADPLFDLNFGGELPEVTARKNAERLEARKHPLRTFAVPVMERLRHNNHHTFREGEPS